MINYTSAFTDIPDSQIENDLINEYYLVYNVEAKEDYVDGDEF